MKLSDLLKQYRQENNISQREFARRCQLSHGSISLFEKGENPQTGKSMAQDLDTYQKLASGMGITIQDLFERLGADASVQLVPLTSRLEISKPKRIFATDAVPNRLESKIEPDISLPQFKEATVDEQICHYLDLWEITKPEAKRLVLRTLNTLNKLEGKK